MSSNAVDPYADTEPEDDSTAAESLGREAVPGEIPGYRILKLLGQGGMGEVYEAEQVGAVRRRVAIKEIKRGMDSLRIVNRFEAERQALAMMDHPGIARIFDAGLTEDHRPYFAMELVEGIPITDYCDEHRLSLDRRIDLFIQVCRAVQHAHLKGIVHRDLKPSNILITLQDGEPVPKVIDFGLAKAMFEPLTERTMATEMGLPMGTMEYMSPEQAQLVETDIDTRTDVYSLGVVLYELLAGTLPFSSKELMAGGYFNALRRVREDEPERPSRGTLKAKDTVEIAARCGLRDPKDLTRRLEGDLDWIVMMALEKDRARRYETVNGLALDLQRHLDDESVLAASPTMRYRVGKFIRRHRLGVTLTSLLIVLIMAFSIVMAVQAARIAKERDRANAEAVTAQETLDFMVDLFQVVDPEEGRGNTVTAREVLDAGTEQLRLRLDDQPLVRARLLDTIGAVYLSLGLNDEAEPLIRDALTIRETELGRPSKEVAESLRRMAEVDTVKGANEQAEELARQAVQMLEVAQGAGPLDRAEALHVLGWTMARRGKFGAAEPVFAEALSIRRQWLEDDDPKVAQSLYDLGTVIYELGRYDETKPLFDAALQIYEARFGSRHIQVRSILNMMGVVARAQGRLEEGEAYMRRALAITEEVLDPNSRRLASDMNNLALLLDSQGKFDEAEPLLSRSLEIYRRTVGEHHQFYGLALGNLAWINFRKQSFERAEEQYEEALSVLIEAVGPSNSMVATIQLDFAKLLNQTGELSKGLEMVEAALESQSSALGDEHPAVVECLKVKAELLRKFGDVAQARTLLDRALAIQVSALGPEHPDTKRIRETITGLSETGG